MKKMKEVNKLFRKFLKEAKNEGYPHNAINQIVGRTRKAVLTEAEVEAGHRFYLWVLKPLKGLAKRYAVIGGKTWTFAIGDKNEDRVLIPEPLAHQRLGMNSHLWNEKGYDFICR